MSQGVTLEFVKSLHPRAAHGMFRMNYDCYAYHQYKLRFHSDLNIATSLLELNEKVTKF